MGTPLPTVVIDVDGLSRSLTIPAAAANSNKDAAEIWLRPSTLSVLSAGFEDLKFLQPRCLESKEIESLHAWLPAFNITENA